MMAESFSNSPRLFIDAPIEKGAVLPLAIEKTHYLRHVMRLPEGGSVRVFNGSAGEWRALLFSKGKKDSQLVVEEQLCQQTRLRPLTLCCAPIKKVHFEFMIEKATELGVSAFAPILTQHTQVREINQERVASIATEAAEQSERLSVPTIVPPLLLLKRLETLPSDGKLIVCAEVGPAEPIGEVFAKLTVSEKATVIMTGPEGGFTPEELDQLRSVQNACFVRLGPRILRADTAALAALACWQALQGDWNSA